MKCVALLLLASVAARPETNQERGKRVVTECLQALGGEKFIAMRDRVESGRVYSFYESKLSGLSRAKIYTRYLTSPQKAEENKVWLRERDSYGKKDDEEWATLFDENGGWSITYRGAQPLAKDIYPRFLETTRRNFFYILRERLEEPGLIFESRGAEVLDNQPVEVVDIIDSANNTTTAYIHTSTKLPVKQRFVRRDAATREQHEEITYFSKYRDVGGGVQWPYSIMRQRDGQKLFEIYSESVAINQDFPDQMFTLPANIKMLPPPR